MIPINCLIVDDNEIDRLNIEDYLSLDSDFALLGSFNNPLECLQMLNTQKIDVLFLDIDMPVIDGLSFFKNLKQPPICVFVTSFPDYAVDAFAIEALDYLLKPVNQHRFEKAAKRIKTLVSLKLKAEESKVAIENDTITFKEDNAITIVMVNDIIFLEALANWTKVVTPAKKFLPLYNLKSFLQQLPEDKFLRVHRSYAVAKNKISKLKSNELTLGEYNIPVGKTYRRSVIDYLSAKQ